MNLITISSFCLNLIIPHSIFNSENLSLKGGEKRSISPTAIYVFAVRGGIFKQQAADLVTVHMSFTWGNNSQVVKPCSYHMLLLLGNECKHVTYQP